jgi:hypothetical protein
VRMPLRITVQGGERDLARSIRTTQVHLGIQGYQRNGKIPRILRNAALIDTENGMVAVESEASPCSATARSLRE